MPGTTRSASESRRPLYQDKSLQVFAGMVLGALIGAIWPLTAPWISTRADLFIRLIAMFVGVIISCSVVHGIATVREAASGTCRYKGADLFRSGDNVRTDPWARRD